jgi:PAS domain S-box-containing protein
VVGGHLTEANDEFLRTIGYSRVDLEAGHVSWQAVTAAEDGALEDGRLEELTRRGECAPCENAYVRKDGLRVPVLVGVTVVTRFPLECLVLHDLTVRKAVEQELREGEAQFKALAHLVPTAGR